MSGKNNLIVPGIEKMISDYKEEIAEEFGTHFTPASRDVITRELSDDKKKKKEAERKDQGRNQDNKE